VFFRCSSGRFETHHPGVNIADLVGFVDQPTKLVLPPSSRCRCVLVFNHGAE
jgi:hypothetical protein